MVAGLCGSGDVNVVVGVVVVVVGSWLAVVHMYCDQKLQIFFFGTLPPPPP